MLAAACGGSGPPPAAPAAPAVDARTAEKDAKGLVVEIFETIDRGNTDSMFSLLADPLIVLGPRRADAMTTRSDALVALGKVVDPRARKHPQLRSTALAVAVSPGGRSAWAFDVVHFGGATVAVTAILSNTSDLWSVTTAALALVPGPARAKAESARDAIVPPGGAAAGKVDPAAARLVDDWKKGLLDQDSWGIELMSQSDAIYAGPTAGEVAHGKQAIKQLWKARIKANVREAVSGPITAAVTPDGQLAWLSAPVTRVASGEDPLPLRSFAVYEKDGAAWRLIVLHEGLAIDAPGSGTAYKKIVPAPPAPPRAEPARPEDKPADTATAKRAKKKKKPKPAPRSDDP
ncbi:MAG TPA: nuclear transport factor 2 family protein [Kofleriaceae bacterium]|nr:nuclear transport factor 2 family protein [Kofleriaceae bacterium]